MNGIGLGFAVEGLVTVLLAVTVGYCIMLDKRLRRFRADEKGMRQTVVDLAMATERADRAISGLRSTLTEADGSLVERLKAAESFTRELDIQLKSGGQILSRISKIVASSRQVSSNEQVLDDEAAHIGNETEPSVTLQDVRSSRLADMLAAARAMADRGRNRQALIVNSNIQQTAA